MVVRRCTIFRLSICLGAHNERSARYLAVGVCCAGRSGVRIKTWPLQNFVKRPAMNSSQKSHLYRLHFEITDFLSLPSLSTGHFFLEIYRISAWPIYRADISVSPIYRYRPKRPIWPASVGVDNALLYSSRIQTTCARKQRTKPRQLSYSNVSRCVFINK